MSAIIEEVKKEIEAKELEAKKEKIRKMLELISSQEKNLDLTVKKQEEWVTSKKEYIAKLKDQLEKEDYSSVESRIDSGCGVFLRSDGCFHLCFTSLTTQ